MMTFDAHEKQSDRKTFWEKEKKMLVISILSFFPYNIFYPNEHRNHLLIYSQFVVYTCYQFGPV